VIAEQELETTQVSNKKRINTRIELKRGFTIALPLEADRAVSAAQAG